METLSVAIIGLGRIASLLEDDKLREKPCTHAGAIRDNPVCVLAAGADIDPQRREAFKARWGCPVYAEAKQMLQEIRPQIVHIATHPDSHLHYAALAEACKVPVVVCEKPLADTLGQARKIAAIHRRGNTKIITNHERRYSVNYQQMREIISDRRYGDLQSLKGTLYMGKTRRILDILWHDGTHMADALAFLADGYPVHKKTAGDSLDSHQGTAFFFGEIRRKKHRGQIPQAPVPFVIETGSGRDHLVFEIEGSLEKARLRVGNGVFEIWESAQSPYAEGFRSLTRLPTVFTGATGYFSNMMADAVSCAAASKLAPVSSAEDGLAVIQYLTSIHRW